MNPLGVVLVGLLGWFVGAAVWVVAHARASDRPRLAGPACAACGARLPAKGWLPLLGLGAVRRCRACGVAQPARRPVFELAVAGYYGLAAARLGDDPLSLVAALLFAVPLLVVLLVDAWTRLIHTDVIAIGTILGLAVAALGGWRSLFAALGAAAGAALVFACFFLLAAVLYRNLGVAPFGLGDVSLAAMIGAMTGVPAVIRALFLGILLAGLVSIALLLTRRTGRRQAVAYGPYLCLGALLTLLG